MTKYYTKVNYYDAMPETETFESADEAQEAYAELLDLVLDGAMGDISRVSFGRLVGGQYRCMASRDYP